MTISIDQRIVGTPGPGRPAPPGTHRADGGSGQAPVRRPDLAVAGKLLDVKPGAGIGAEEGTSAAAARALHPGHRLAPVHGHAPAGLPQPQVRSQRRLRPPIRLPGQQHRGLRSSYGAQQHHDQPEGDETGSRATASSPIAWPPRCGSISPGKTWRFVGTVGGGVVVDGVEVRQGRGTRTCNAAAANGRVPVRHPGSVGVDAFVMFEAGVELDIDHVLIDLRVTSQFQSTGNLNTSKVG